MKLDYAKLFTQALANLIDTYGGSIETALDECGIVSEDIRKQIKEDFGWEEECEELEEEIEMNTVRKYRRKKDGHEFIRYDCDKEELYGDTRTRLYSTQDHSGNSDINIDIKDLDTDYELLEEWEEEA